MRVYNRGNGIWVLNGLAIRIAESMGLHRDGGQLALSPFQAEIRRRVCEFTCTLCTVVNRICGDQSKRLREGLAKLFSSFTLE